MSFTYCVILNLHFVLKKYTQDLLLMPTWSTTYNMLKHHKNISLN